jgi:hypothetical protein
MLVPPSSTGFIPGRKADLPKQVTGSSMPQQLSLKTALAVAVVGGAVLAYVAMTLELFHLLLH